MLHLSSSPHAQVWLDKYKVVMASAVSAVRRGVDPLRLQALKQLQCSIFSTTYNPTNARNGAKYLKGRLRGPLMVQYYPPRITFKEIEHILDGEFGVTDLAEQERLDDVEGRKRRGKGAPKKAKTKGALLFSSLILLKTGTCVLIVIYRG
jgi:small subunit ribosomal protein S33